MNNKIISSKKCPKCKNKHYKEGIFCSYKCSNSRIMSKETRRKISNSLKGNTNILGKHYKFTTESRKKHSEALKKYWLRRDIEKLKEKPLEEHNWRFIKKIIYRERILKCESCGYDYIDKNNKGPYDVHHKDGNRNNSKRENLEILCLNCHWKTDNWKFKGKKHTPETLKKIVRKAKKYYKNKAFMA